MSTTRRKYSAVLLVVMIQKFYNDESFDIGGIKYAIREIDKDMHSGYIILPLKHKFTIMIS